MALSDDYLRGSGAYDYAVKREHYSGSAFGRRGHGIQHATRWIERHPGAAELIRSVLTLAVLSAVALVAWRLITGG